MYLNSFKLHNYRRLKDVHVSLDKEISIFVGANNSGKTSATQAVEMFVKEAKFSFYDFSASTWETFNKISAALEKNESPEPFPTIHTDLWFDVDAADLHRVIDILPSLDWRGTQVGIRIEYCAKDAEETIANYQSEKAKINTTASKTKESTYKPWPNDIQDYLQKKLSEEYGFVYYVLDRSKFDDNFEPMAGYSPVLMDTDIGKKVIKSLIRIDRLNAQRHLADVTTSARAEDLSRCLSRFYQRNLQKHEDDLEVLKALSESEVKLDDHLARVFDPTLSKLGKLGYPGISNPKLVIKSALNPTSIMSQDARVHYALNDDANSRVTLPDNYNGLGFKNLIYMVMEILDLQARWIDDQVNRAALHLVFIEEPEAHLHAQLQQVFIRQILDLVQIEGEEESPYKTQLGVTTHSPHILYERGFEPIRYFRREGLGIDQTTKVLSLSLFNANSPASDRNFLQKYLKLTHCDLFFADAVILVEGNVERLLMPVMIEKCASELQTSYLSILEVGGAFAHKFKGLIEFLGLHTLIVTDLDSVGVAKKTSEDKHVETSEDEEITEDTSEVKASTCAAMVSDALTSNAVLRKWLPKMNTVKELFEADNATCTQAATKTSPATVFVTYQKPQAITWKGITSNLTGRTFEEIFGLENAAWCQDKDRKHIGLRLRKEATHPEELAERIHKRVTSKSFNKTNFALGVLSEDQSEWNVPSYIVIGLNWLVKALGANGSTIKDKGDDAPETLSV